MHALFPRCCTVVVVKRSKGEAYDDSNCRGSPLAFPCLAMRTRRADLSRCVCGVYIVSRREVLLSTTIEATIPYRPCLPTNLSTTGARCLLPPNNWPQSLFLDYFVGRVQSAVHVHVGLKIYRQFISRGCPAIHSSIR